MAAYAASITLQVYRSFFENTLDLKRLPTYATLDLPMLAICGSGEVVDMKTSLALLGENAHCRTLMLSQAGHDFLLLPRHQPEGRGHLLHGRL